MVLRLGSYLFPSVIVHCAFFAALTGVPATVESATPMDSIEYITITDDGGGRIGNDTQIGDADKPAEVVEKKFRRVAPTPARKRLAAAAAIAPSDTEHESSDAVDEHGADNDGADSTASSHSLVRGSAGDDPNASASGVGSGGEGVDRRAALRAWLREIQREVNKIATRNYPSSAVRMRLEGHLKLGITIAADGAIMGVRVLSSSGHAVLDDSATESVMALRIPAPPEALAWQEREISLPIRYALQ